MAGKLTISAKDLGKLALPEFCPRCFWLKRKVGRLPYQIFPGIFSSIDAYTKRVTHGWFDEHGTAPGWLDELGELSGYVDPPHWSHFNVTDNTSGVTLRGSPDAIFTRPDGSYVVADYKTAKFTATQDELFPLYEVQLNAYAYIGEANGISPVSDLALIYTEPVTDRAAAVEDANRRETGFAMGFMAKILQVDLDLDRIPDLLAEVRRYSQMDAPPEKRDGCKDCEQVGRLADLAGD